MVIDRAAPNISCVVNGGEEGEAGWYKSPPTLEARFEDGLSGVAMETCQYRIDGGPWSSYRGPFLASEGAHSYSFRCSDRAGNSSEKTSVEIKVDTQAPLCSYSLPPADGLNGWRISDDAARVTLCFQDNPGGSGPGEILYAWDGSPSEVYGGPLTAPEGVHILFYQSRDKAGNQGEVLCLEVRKDTTPPTVIITEPSREEWIKGMVAVKATAEDNCEVGAVDFFIDDKPLERRQAPPWMGSLDTTCWINGSHHISALAYDIAGNRCANEDRLEIFVGNNLSECNHFAEGCTRNGFDTWLCLQNPGMEPAQVTVKYLLGPGQGNVPPRNYVVPPHSRTTVFVNSDVGPGKDVSIQVSSSKPIVSERPMYFNYGAGIRNWRGGHTAQGVDSPHQEWYLAEGSTYNGMEEYICIQNPNDNSTQVQVEYMMEDGGNLVGNYQVGAWQRFTLHVNSEIGYGHNVSTHLISTLPVGVERPMYFNYMGMWDGGHNVMGATRPERTWYFAEGCTRSGFNEWLCIQNPGEEEAVADITYMMEDGGTVYKRYTVRARGRLTINVNDDVARQHDVSVKLVSDNPVVVERPMYFKYRMAMDEGSNTMGVNKPCSTWYLAEGCTRAGFEEWICLQNAGDREALVLLRFMLEDGSLKEHRVAVSAGFRVTVNVNQVVGGGHDVSTEVLCDYPIICERPIYATYNSLIQAADTLAGYRFNP